MPNAANTPPVTAPENRRSAKKPRSSMGSGVCRSHQPNAASATAPRPSAVSTRVEPHPCSGCEMTAHTSEVMAIVDSTEPSTSGLRTVGSFDSGTSSTTAATASAATGTLTRNTEPHQKWSIRTPPMTGPPARPTDETAAQMAIALGRSRSSNSCTSTASVPGMRNAAPRPMNARAAMRASGEPAQAATADPRPNTARPVTSARLRPNRSDNAPDVSSRPASTSE